MAHGCETDLDGRTCDIFLNRVLGDGQTQLEQFPTNALGTPQLILLRHPLDQRERLRGKLGTTTAVT